MSGGAKTILSLLVLVVLVGGGWYLYKHMGTKSQPAQQTQDQTAGQQTQDQTPPQSLITSNDTSDAGIASDLSAVDGQMNVVSKDSADVDASMNDKQITQ